MVSLTPRQITPAQGHLTDVSPSPLGSQAAWDGVLITTFARLMNSSLITMIPETSSFSLVFHGGLLQLVLLLGLFATWESSPRCICHGFQSCGRHIAKIQAAGHLDARPGTSIITRNWD